MKKVFRTIGLALLGSLLFGLVIGTLIDRRAQQPVIYIGASVGDSVGSSEAFGSEVLASGPGTLG
jgi:hypothetical protein